MKTEPNLNVDIAIFTAMSEELQYFKDYFAKHPKQTKTIRDFTFDIYDVNDVQILLSETGLGTTFSSSVLTFVCHTFTPSYVLLSGTAGAINQKLKLCDVVIAENAFEAEIQKVFPLVKNTPFESCLTHPLKEQRFPNIYPASKKLLKFAQDIKNKNIFFGNVVTSNNFPSPIELFEDIKSLSPYSIDMETSAFYQVAWLFGIEVLAIRSISNILNIDGTDDHIDESDVEGSSKAAAITTLKIVEKLSSTICVTA